MLFGSLLVPLKALVLNFLSLTATFGAMVFIFQDGHGSGLLDFTATGDIAGAMPILMFCIAFGLSMDYEVFLLRGSRKSTIAVRIRCGPWRSGWSAPGASY